MCEYVLKHFPVVATPENRHRVEMADYVSELKSCIQNVAFGENSTENWTLLESALSTWKEPCEGGYVDCDFVDDNLEFLLENHAQLLRSIFHISKMTPTEQTNGAICAARTVFCRLVGAIERAAIVARLRGENVYSSSPCPTPTSPVFGSRGSALSPVVSKCK